MSTNQNSDACTAFGGFVRQRRKDLRKTARVVATEAGILPSNYCKLEYGALQAPRDGEKLRGLAHALQLPESDPLTYRFYELAAGSTDSIPVHVADLISREEVIPMMARTLGSRKLTQEQIDQIMFIIREEK